MRSDVTIGAALSRESNLSADICAMAHISKETELERINGNWKHVFMDGLTETLYFNLVAILKVLDKGF